MPKKRTVKKTVRKVIREAKTSVFNVKQFIVKIVQSKSD